MPRSRPGPAIAFPSSMSEPVVGSSRPATMRRIVDFPQPEGPSRAQRSLSRTSKETSATAWIRSPEPMRNSFERSTTESFVFRRRSLMRVPPVAMPCEVGFGVPEPESSGRIGGCAAAADPAGSEGSLTGASAYPAAVAGRVQV